MDTVDVIHEISNTKKPREREGIVRAKHFTHLLVQPKGSTRPVPCDYESGSLVDVGDQVTFLWVQSSKKYIVSAVISTPKTIKPTTGTVITTNREHVLHDNIGGEVLAIRQKPVPVDDDLLFGNDSEDGYRPKSFRVGDLPGGGGGGSIAVDDGTDTVNPASQVSFDPAFFDVTDAGGGQALVTFIGTGGGGGGGSTDFILIREEQTSGTAGGTFNSGAWRTRVLNTLVTNEGAHASLASNQVTLAAGTYRIRASAPAFYVGGHQARWQNITDSVTTIVGSSAYSEASTVDGITTVSIIDGTFTIASPKVFELQHAAQSNKATNGFGAAVGAGINEVYSIVELECVVSGGVSTSSPALIYDYTLPADGTFDTNTTDDLGNTGISQLYTDLELRISGIGAAGVTAGVEVFFNGDTNTAHYDGGRSLVNGGSSGGDLNEIGFVGTSGVGLYGSIIADVPGYAITSIHRTLIARSAVDGGGTSPNFWHYALQHNQAGALTRFQAHCRSAGNFAAGSRLRIYGIP